MDADNETILSKISVLVASSLIDASWAQVHYKSKLGGWIFTDSFWYMGIVCSTSLLASLQVGLLFHLDTTKTGFDLIDNYLYCKLPDRVFSFSFALNISEDRDSMASLGNLLHCSTTLTVKRWLVCLDGISWFLIYFPFVLSCWCTQLRITWFPLLCSHLPGIYKYY